MMVARMTRIVVSGLRGLGLVVNVTVIQASLSHDRRPLSVTLTGPDLERLVRIATRGKPACDDARAGKRCVELQAGCSEGAGRTPGAQRQFNGDGLLKTRARQLRGLVVRLHRGLE